MKENGSLSFTKDVEFLVAAKEKTQVNIIMGLPGSSSSSTTATPMTDFWFPTGDRSSSELKEKNYNIQYMNKSHE